MRSWKARKGMWVVRPSNETAGLDLLPKVISGSGALGERALFSGNYFWRIL